MPTASSFDNLNFNHRLSKLGSAIWIERKTVKELETSSQQYPCLFVAGPHPSGKTSLLRNVFPKADYVTVDYPAEAAEADQDGDSFLLRHKETLVVDEVQYAPNLFRFLKIAIDKDRQGILAINEQQIKQSRIMRSERLFFRLPIASSSKKFIDSNYVVPETDRVFNKNQGFLRQDLWQMHQYIYQQTMSTLDLFYM